MVIQRMFTALGGGHASLRSELDVEIGLLLAAALASDTDVGECGVE